MNRRDLLTGILAVPAAAMAAKGACGAVMIDDHHVDLFPSRALPEWPSPLGEGLLAALRALNVPHGTVRIGNLARRGEMAEAMSPVVDGHMRGWREAWGVRPTLSPYQDIHEHAWITVVEAYEIGPDREAILDLVAKRVWGRVEVLKAREAVMSAAPGAAVVPLPHPRWVPAPCGPVPLRTSVAAEDRPDLRVIGFGVRTFARDGYWGPLHHRWDECGYEV